MEKTYLLNKSDFVCPDEFKNQLFLKEILTAEEAKDFIELQSEFSYEISVPIFILNEFSLTEKNQLAPEGLIFCLAKDKMKCIGYGYGYIDKDDGAFKLDTIGVTLEHRGKKIGTEIKAMLVKHAFENPKITRIKAITQSDNIKTIYINRKLGFKDYQFLKASPTEE